MSMFGPYTPGGCLRSSGQRLALGWLHHLGALGPPERRQHSVVDVALHTRTKLLQGHFRSIGEPQTVVMWAALQASEGDIFILPIRRAIFVQPQGCLRASVSCHTPCTRRLKDHQAQRSQCCSSQNDASHTSRRAALADYDTLPGSNHTLCPPSSSSIAPNAWQGRRLSRSKNLIFGRAVAN